MMYVDFELPGVFMDIRALTVCLSAGTCSSAGYNQLATMIFGQKEDSGDIEPALAANGCLGWATPSSKYSSF